MGILVSHGRTLHTNALSSENTLSRRAVSCSPRSALASTHGYACGIRLTGTLMHAGRSARHIAGNREIKIDLGTFPRQIGTDKFFAIKGADRAVFGTVDEVERRENVVAGSGYADADAAIFQEIALRHDASVALATAKLEAKIFRVLD